MTFEQFLAEIKGGTLPHPHGKSPFASGQTVSYRFAINAERPSH